MNQNYRNKQEMLPAYLTNLVKFKSENSALQKLVSIKLKFYNITNAGLNFLSDILII